MRSHHLSFGIPAARAAAAAASTTSTTATATAIAAEETKKWMKAKAAAAGAAAAAASAAAAAPATTNYYRRYGTAALLLLFLLFGSSCCVRPAAAGLYSSSGPVKVMNAQEFRSNVINSHDLHIVEFFADWCGHCQQFAPEYEKAAKALRGIVKFVAVSDQSAMGEFDVKGFPTVKAFVGKGGKTPKTFDYNQQRTASALVDFALQHLGKLAKARLSGKVDAGEDTKSSSSSGSSSEKKKKEGPSDVVVLTDENFNKTVLQDTNNVWFVEFYAPWCGHCKNLAPTWEELATAVKGKVRVGKVDATAEKILASTYQIQGFPTLKLFPLGEKSPMLAKNYEGPRSLEALTNYCMEFFSAKVQAEQLVSEEQLQELCGKRLCLISFLPHILDTSVEKRKEYLDILNQITRASFHMPITFLWSQGGDQYEFEEQLSLAFGYPAVVAIHLAKGKYAVHRGDFSRESISTFLTQLLAGKAQVSDLPKNLKKLQTVEAWEAPEEKESSKGGAEKTKKKKMKKEEETKEEEEEEEKEKDAAAEKEEEKKEEEEKKKSKKEQKKKSAAAEKDEL